MAWFAVDLDGSEVAFQNKPIRDKKEKYWYAEDEHYVELPLGTIEKIIGKKITWRHESVEVKQ